VIRRLWQRTELPVDASATGGRARVDRRTKVLLSRLEPGEVAIIDHQDIDRIAAEGLIQRQARIVINAGRSSTGRYPNLGPLLLCSAGVTVIDEAGPEVMQIEEGTRVEVEEGSVFAIANGERRQVAKGKVLHLEDVEKTLDVAKQGIATAIDRFAENTIGYIKDERDVLLEAARLPNVKTAFHGRHVLVVVRGPGYKEDFVALRGYIREVKPLLVGVDGGADAILDAGMKPDMIIGDMDSVTTEALLSGAEVVVHAYSGGHAPGLERIEALDIPCIVYESPGTSEDIAMLLAFERGAELIVAVGTHANLIEFLDKGRKGMASTFLVRLRVGPILVDAKGVGRLYRGRVRNMDLLMLLAAAIVAMSVVVAMSPVMRLEMHAIWLQLHGLWFNITQAVFS
jgi:uncharacterized membrane-anchored protein